MMWSWLQPGYRAVGGGDGQRQASGVVWGEGGGTKDTGLHNTLVMVSG